ncbi:MAG: hypothetical protein F2923_08340 [Actinobacteria bacterium]|uniref:Unannotated protein n=1 Tax=freshwater metagenome TaxID=449393 RepID=A0A6J7SMW7_9ZZZZ|nr:hypothetical protein [Actinomycetota bacterium]MTB28630.1 hypothetical protein [Actinomycetota bacterium]
MDFAFLAGYIALAALAFTWARSTAWWVISTVASVSIAGGLVNLGITAGHDWNRQELQILLLVALLVVSAAAWLRRTNSDLWELKRQFISILLPTLLLLIFFIIVTRFWVTETAFMHPVSFFIGHSEAEDNAKWLDFAGQYASGAGIHQAVPLGGPLELVVTLMATFAAAISQLAFGGFNEVAVAANAIVFAEYFLVICAPLALAPLVEARLSGQKTGIKVPSPAIWVGAIVIAVANLVAIGYGHLTFQFVVLVGALWAATFLSDIKMQRAKLLTSLVMVEAMTVWLPLNALAVVVLLGWLVILIRRWLQRESRDLLSIGLWVVVAISVWEPIRSSLAFVVNTAPVASGEIGAGSGVRAGVLAGLADSTLFAAGGGTDQTGPILALVAISAVVSAGLYLASQNSAGNRTIYIRFIPVALTAGMALLINLLDAWATGSGPHYGSLKFTFMTSVVLVAACLPIGVMFLDRSVNSGMTPLRWIALVSVVFLLIVDTLIPRGIAQARPDHWNPPNPNNNSASYWWPADVKATARQSIAGSPVGCVFLPQGAMVPSALLPASGNSDAQRVYSCTRLLAGLAGQDTQAQPLVDWLRREWLTNTPAWSDVYDGLAAMPASVLNKPMILLDEYSNVIGYETLGALLSKYPKFAGKTPDELALINSN